MFSLFLIFYKLQVIFVCMVRINFEVYFEFKTLIFSPTVNYYDKSLEERK